MDSRKNLYNIFVPEKNRLRSEFRPINEKVFRFFRIGTQNGISGSIKSFTEFVRFIRINLILRIMKKKAALLFFLAFFSFSVFSQNSPPPPAKTPEPKAAPPAIVSDEDTPPPLAPPKPPPPPPPPAPARDYNPEIWKEYVFVEDGFRAKFPGDPRKKLKIDGESLKKLADEFVYGYEGFILYTVKIEDISPDDLVKKDTPAAFNEIKNKRLRQLGANAKAVADTKSEVGGCATRRVDYEAEKNLLFREIYFICTDRLFQISVRTERGGNRNLMGSENSYGKIAESFLSGFKPLTAQENKTLKSSELPFDGKFSDLINRFRVEFPEKPQITEEYEGEELKETSFIAVLDGFEYRLNVNQMTANFSFTDKLREKLYSQWEKGFLQSYKGKVASSVAFDFKGATGRDLVFEAPDNPIFRVRLLAVDGKLYSLSLMDTSASPTAARDNAGKEKAQRFFASFQKLFELEPPQYVGTIYGNTYTSEYYGISFSVPKDWKVQGGQLFIATEDENGEELVLDDPAHTNQKPIFYVAQKNSDETGLRSAIRVQGRLIGRVNVTKDFLDTLRESILKTYPDVKLIKDFVPEKINSTGIWCGEFELKTKNSDKILLKNCFTIKNNYFFVVNALVNDEADRKVIEDFVKSFRFVER